MFGVRCHALCVFWPQWARYHHPVLYRVIQEEMVVFSGVIESFRSVCHYLFT